MIALATMAYGNATEAPNYTTPNAFVEIESNVVYYGFNKIHPKGSQMDIIDKHIDEIRNNQNVLVRITSHTDHIGDWEVNLDVSRKRALAIAEYLRLNGVPQDQIVLDWLGESTPMYFADHEKHKNRRSHISIVRKITVQTPVEPKAVPLVNTSPSDHNIKAQVVIYPKKEESIEKIELKPKEPAYTAIPMTDLSSEYEIDMSASPAAPMIQVKTVEKVEETEELTEKGGFEFQKNILFVDSITMQPIIVNVDLKTKSGKQSFTSTNKGILNIDYSESKTQQMDVFAHGYFYESVKIKSGPFQQIVKLKPTVKGEKLEINNLEFVSGKSILMSESRKELEKIYISLTMNPDAKIEIGGHVNAQGRPRKLNPKKFQISVDRAKAVYNYLVKRGIPKDNITYKGYGNSKMIHPKPKNEAEKAKNRRVEIKILK